MFPYENNNHPDLFFGVLEALLQAKNKASQHLEDLLNKNNNALQVSPQQCI